MATIVQQAYTDFKALRLNGTNQDAWKRNPTDQMVEVVRVAKKAAKKSWEALGFTESEIKLIKEKIEK